MLTCRTVHERVKLQHEAIYKPDDNLFSEPAVVLAFSAMMILSGVLCFALEKDWFVGTNYKWKVTYYAMLGMSVAFIVIFIIADFLNYCSLVCMTVFARPLIECPRQIYVLTMASVLMGAMYGLLFGMLDVSEANIYRLALVQLSGKAHRFQIGMALGAVAGIASEVMRQKRSELRIDLGEVATRFEEQDGL